MLFGPIAHVELVRISRQKRWYVLRTLLGLTLLLILNQGYQTFRSYASWSGLSSHDALRMISTEVFYSLMVCQATIIVFLVPAITAGAIAEEKQRKTLHYLLASRLTSLEIVVGKLTSRLLLIAMPVAISLPVMVMLGLFGGIDLNLVLAGYAAIACTALFEGSLAILISTMVRRGREALLMTFLVVLAWLFVPMILETLMLNGEEPWPSIYLTWFESLNRHLIDLGPFGLMNDRVRRAGPSMVVGSVLRMIVHQLAASVMLILLATWQVRPAFRRQDGAPIFGKGLTRAIRRKYLDWRPRRACGDDAMLWKETHGAPGAILVNFVSYLTVVVVVLCAFQPLRETVPMAWEALLRAGYAVRDDIDRRQLNVVLRAMNTALFCVLGLVLATLGSTSISREREDDTWISLIATPIDGRSIVTAKLVGCLWAVRPMIATIAFIWIFGLVLGAFHPLGIAISGFQLAVFVLFIIALGTRVSLGAKTTLRSVGLTFGILLFLSLIVPILVRIVEAGDMSGLVTSLPFLFTIGMLSYRNVGTAITGSLPVSAPYEREELQAIMKITILGTLGFLTVGLILINNAYKSLDRLLDRPRRPPGSRLNHVPAAERVDPRAVEPGVTPASRA